MQYKIQMYLFDLGYDFTNSIGILIKWDINILDPLHSAFDKRNFYIHSDSITK